MFTPGIHLDLPDSIYYARQLDVISYSGAKLLLDRSPAHYRWAIEHPDTGDTPAMMFGRMLHCAVLEPDRFAARYVVLPTDAPPKPTSRQREAKRPSKDTVRAIAWWDAFLAEQAGRELVRQEDVDRALRMADAILAHPEAGGLFRVGGHNEVSGYYLDEESGTRASFRADRWLPELGLVADLKTCDDAGAEACARAIARFRYHLQHAVVCEGFRALGQPLRHYLMVFVEREPPHAVSVRFVAGPGEERGYELKRQAFSLHKRCVDAGHWPAFPGIHPTNLPAWAMYE